MSKDNRDVWGEGIPQYKEEDILQGEELLKFAIEIVCQNDLVPNGYEIIAVSYKLGQIPDIVCKKDGKTYFVLVKACVFPDEPYISIEEKKEFIAHAAKFNAVCYSASVGIQSIDKERAEAELALKHDGYYIKFEGLQPIGFKTTTEWIRKAMKEIALLEPETQTNIVEDAPIRYSLSERKHANFDSWKKEIATPTFQEMLMTCIERKGLTNQEFYKAALIDRKLFSAIKNNPEYQPKKETVVACCFGLNLNLADAEKLIELAGYTLSLSIAWDRVVYYCLKNRITDIDIVNELLYEETEKCIRV